MDWKDLLEWCICMVLKCYRYNFDLYQRCLNKRPIIRYNFQRSLLYWVHQRNMYRTGDEKNINFLKVDIPRWMRNINSIIRLTIMGSLSLLALTNTHTQHQLWKKSKGILFIILQSRYKLINFLDLSYIEIHKINKL